MIFKKKEHISTLDDVLKSSWKALHRGVGNAGHPFHRPALATVDGNNPQARTVILREFSETERTLICHCDARSPKVSQIRNNAQVSWLFYDPKKWMQLRLFGTASIHTDDQTAEAQWERVSITHRMNYRAETPPGSPAERPTSGLPESLRNTASGLVEHRQARRNFAAILCRFDQMDWLLLRLTGHMRARFHWEDNGVSASWVIP